MNRRIFLRGVGVVTVAGGLAGCSQGGGSGSGGNGTGDGNGTDNMKLVSAPDDVSGWLEDDAYFSDELGGKMVDKTGSDTASVKVGVEANQGPNGFGPSAVTVSKGTTVTWAWTGNGSHNVVAKDETFNSGSAKTSGTFEYTFEKMGTYLYFCTPHKAMGMKGAVVVK
jgi:halocyanin-like protein